MNTNNEHVDLLGDNARDQLVEKMARAMNIATDGHDRYWSGYLKSAEAAHKVVSEHLAKTLSPSASIADTAGAKPVVPMNKRERVIEQQAWERGIDVGKLLGRLKVQDGRIAATPASSVADATGASEGARDAARYRFLRENMRFSSPHDETITMTLNAPIPAPTHDIHNDWMGERFDASVDRTIDAALTKEPEND